MSDRYKDLQERLRVVITQTCNVIGCKDCDLKWNGGCSAIELQNEMIEEDIKEGGQDE